MEQSRWGRNLFHRKSRLGLVGISRQAIIQKRRGDERLELGKYSIGTGDRFARQARAQLTACEQALSNGIEVTPVWNKSNREHMIIGSDPSSARQAADAAVQALHWKLPYYCDADHVTLQTVHRFFAPCDFFTIDVADSIGKAAAAADIDNFVRENRKPAKPAASSPKVSDGGS
jgi:hypothetical protein